MNTKLVSIFTVAGVVAAGSSAYAINAQSLEKATTLKVGTATMDLKNKHVIIPSVPNSAETVSPEIGKDANSAGFVSGSTGISLPINDPQSSVDGVGSEDAGTQTFNPATGQSKKPLPVATNADPVFPTTPPGYKPGQGDDSGDEGDDRGETDDHEDSNGGNGTWEHDD